LKLKSSALPLLCLFLGLSLACAVSLAPTQVPAPTPDFAATSAVHAETQAALDATAQALSAVMTQAAYTPTPEPTATIFISPTPSPTFGPVVIEDDFSEDVGRWVDCDECSISGGTLLMGPYPSVDSYQGYAVLCGDCGIVREYSMSVDITFSSGGSDRGFGLILREYHGAYIDLEISTWQYYGMWFFSPKDDTGWRSILPGGYTFSNALKPGKLTNHVEVKVQQSNTDAEKDIVFIYINGRRINTVEIPASSGRVGLMVGLHSIGVFFDNFFFEGFPSNLLPSPELNG
jgi:hypothetical protein